LIEEIGQLRPDAEESRRRLADPPLLLVLPGSRGSELRRLLAIFGAAIGLVRQRYGPLDLVLPTLPHLAARVRAAVSDWPVTPRILTEPAEKQAAFRTARVALAKSGTVTLELALAGVPTVAAYKIPLLEEMVARLVVRVPSVILPNLVLGENVLPEFLQRACTPENLASALVPLLDAGPERQRQLAAMERLDTVMQIGKMIPSRRAAEIVLDLAATKGGRA
jgi:lipid-A-disaccharide synthase